MPEIIKTMKLHLHTDYATGMLFQEEAERYAAACNFVSQYVFDNGFELNYLNVHKKLYKVVRDSYLLKSQMTISAFKTVTARYKTVKEQLSQKPFRYEDEKGETCYIQRTLEWLWKPVCFRRPQIDLVRGRDYSFTADGLLSINTLDKRAKVAYDLPDCFAAYFDGSWSFGTAKLVSMKGQWYLHIPMTKVVEDTFDASMPMHVVGIDRGLRFLVTTYDEKGKVNFYDGKQILAKRETYRKVRAELQSKGTKSAKRALVRLSGRENRWMADVNHQLSKTLVSQYGPGTLFVLEDLSGVSFAEENLSSRDANGRSELRSWPFYQQKFFLTYKANASGSAVIKVDPKYTSQRCPKCGRIHKANRHHSIHEYICDRCGYRSNDDRVASMNLQFLGTMYVSGDNNPRFGRRKAS